MTVSMEGGGAWGDCEYGGRGSMGMTVSMEGGGAWG